MRFLFCYIISVESIGDIFMILKNKNYFLINKNEYEDILKNDREDVYLYHFIYIKYLENDNVKYIKIDNTKDLELLNDKKILVKYYIRKIHYFNDCDNLSFEYGEPYYIYNVGYFYIGGFIENKNGEELSKINKLFQDYNNNYDKMSFPFNDREYLNLNS